MGIPPHAARLAGAWAVRSAADQLSEPRAGQADESAPGPEPFGAPSRRGRRDRSPRIAVARIMHPLSRHA